MKNNSKKMPLYLLTLIIIAAFSIAVITASFIAGAAVEGELSSFEKLVLLLGKEMEPPVLYGT